MSLSALPDNKQAKHVELSNRGQYNILSSIFKGEIMYNKFRHPLNNKRRLMTVPDDVNWNTVLNYWGKTVPFTGFEPYPEYPGGEMPTELFETIMAEAVLYLGYPYTWGGKTPPYFDCSGFVGYLYKKYGVIPDDVVSYTGTLHDYCIKVPAGEEKAGDLCFWNGSGGTTWEGNAHVAIYIGNGYVIDSSGGGVQYRKVTYHNQSRFAGYFRPPSMEEPETGD